MKNWWIEWTLTHIIAAMIAYTLLVPSGVLPGGRDLVSIVVLAAAAFVAFMIVEHLFPWPNSTRWAEKRVMVSAKRYNNYLNPRVEMCIKKDGRWYIVINRDWTRKRETMIFDLYMVGAKETIKKLHGLSEKRMITELTRIRDKTM